MVLELYSADGHVLYFDLHHHIVPRKSLGTYLEVLEHCLHDPGNSQYCRAGIRSTIPSGPCTEY